MGRDDRPESGGLTSRGAAGLDGLAGILRAGHALLPDSERSRPLGLCLSGGADSCALVLAASRLRGSLPVPVTVLHALHGLRGAESARDRDACRELAARCGFPYLEVEAPVDPGSNLEERARVARYRALRRVHPGVLATAHHRGDQVETMVLRLARGAGPVGLRGIHRLRKDGIWRPLLSVPRETLETACLEAGWTWRLDGSNRDGRHLRNWIRNDWLPGQGDAVASALWRLALSCEALAPVLERRLDDLAARCRLAVDASGFRLEPGAGVAEPRDELLDLLVQRAWTSTGRRPWAESQRLRLLEDVLAGGRGRRRGGQGEIAIWGGGVLQVRPERTGPPADSMEVGSCADG